MPRLRIHALTIFVLVASIPVSADTKITVTVRSEPPGATLYEGAKAFGAAPFVLRYTAPGRFRECLRLRPLTLRWISGASVTLDDLDACPVAGKKQEVTVLRPEGVPGIEIDAQYAVALLQQRNAEQAAADAAAAVALAGLQQQLAKPRTCTSTRIGAQVFTTCL